MTEKQAWMTTPARIIRFWKWTQEYDKFLHWIVDKKEKESEVDG